MGVVKRVRILDDAVNTSKIAADTIIAADIDETAGYNFSNTGNTFSAHSLGKLAMAGVRDVTGAGASTAVGFQDLGGGTFASAPIVVASPVGPTSGTSCSVVSVSASSVNVYISHASSVNFVAMTNPYS